MNRATAAIVIAVLLAACGQRVGIHEQFGARYQQTVAASTDAHGASARTRTTKPRRITITRTRIVGGRQTLSIPDPTVGPDGTLVVTWPQWGALLLDRLGARRCANNLIVVVAWAQQENTAAGWNPLATTLDLAGATLFNSAGVKNYGSLDQGLQATVLTLRNGLTAHGYGAIVEDLRACADPLVTAAAINASDWCSGCAGGTYVIGVVDDVIAAYVSSTRSP